MHVVFQALKSLLGQQVVLWIVCIALDLNACLTDDCSCPASALFGAYPVGFPPGGFAPGYMSGAVPPPPHRSTFEHDLHKLFKLNMRLLQGKAMGSLSDQSSDSGDYHYAI